MANLTRTQTQFVDGPNDNSLTLFLDQNNVLNVKDFQQNYNPITCYTGGGGGGGLIDVGEGCCSSIRINVGNQAFGCYGSALSGLNNITCNDFTANTWGRNNCVVGCYSSASGTSNIVVARQSHILSGTNNTIACDATQGSFGNFTSSSYSGNYFQASDMPIDGGVAFGFIQSYNCDLTSKWPIGSTFSVTYSYAYGTTGTGSCCYGQFQMANVPVICSEYVAPYTRLYFCYDPTSPSFIGNYPSYYTNGGGCCVTFSNGYLQKTGSFSSYSTYGASYHPNLITGGAFNTITAYTSGATISGGYQNTISNGYASIHGGCYNMIDNGGDIFGGRQNRSCQGYNTFISGSNNTNCVSYGGLLVGQNNCACNSSNQTITGAQNHICNSQFSSIIGGQNNRIAIQSGNSAIFSSASSIIEFSSYARIIASLQSAICVSQFSSITGGNTNIICCGSYNTISGGYSNTINGGGCLNSIIGQGNTICTTSVSNRILGGGNTILGSSNNNIIGSSNCVPLNRFAVNILGINMTANRDCATFVNNLSIMSIPTSSSGLPSGAVWSNAGVLTIVP